MKLAIPKEILTQHVAVLGKTGSGKTSTAKLAIEQVVAEGARVCVLDPIKSDWWGLTSSVNGKSAGLPFHILGGPHGHVPLHSAAGKAIADVVASGALPLSIIDMADFEPGGQARFFVDFAPALLRKMRGVVYLVIEEAHLFAPKERSGIGAENLSIHWAKTMATAGRSKGVRLMLVTQRTQALHNALLGSCDTLIAHRLTAPADQEPVVKWLKANTSKDVLDQVAGSLASLKTGEGWICSGEAKLFERVHFPRITTYDNTATPTGDAKVREVKTAKVDEEKLRAIIGDAVDQAKAEDPRELRKQVVELKRQLANQQTVKGSPTGEKVTGKVAPALTDADRQLLTKFAERFEQLQAALTTNYTFNVDDIADSSARLMAKELRGVASEIAEAQGSARDKFLKLAEGKQFLKLMEKLPDARHVHATGDARRGAVAGHQAAHRSPVDRPAPAPRSRPADAGSSGGFARTANPTGGGADGNGHLGTGERAVLIAAAQYPEGVTREQVTILAGYKRSTRDAYIQRLQQKGYVLVNGAMVLATPEGIDVLGVDYEPLPTGQALQQYWLARLPAGEAKVLQLAINNYPISIDREFMTEETGFKRSTRDAYIQRLMTRKLLVKSGGPITASAVLFE